MDGRPIGVFDSGFGGLTVARALIDLLPAEHLVYIGDTARYPYGPRPLPEVSAFARQIARWLVEEAEVKLVVVACNTASAAALSELEGAFDVPVIGVIEPGVRASVRATSNRRLGVIGTVGTIASGAYQRAVAAEDDGVVLTCAACPGFVEFVERGDTESDQVHVLAERLLAPLVNAGVDTLLLGCTHYPFLARTLADVMGRDVLLVSSAEETAFEVRDALSAGGLALPGTGEGTQRFISSGEAGLFGDLGRRLLGPEIQTVETIRWADPGSGAPAKLTSASGHGTEGLRRAVGPVPVGGMRAGGVPAGPVPAGGMRAGGVQAGPEPAAGPPAAGPRRRVLGSIGSGERP